MVRDSGTNRRQLLKRTGALGAVGVGGLLAGCSGGDGSGDGNGDGDDGSGGGSGGGGTDGGDGGSDGLDEIHVGVVNPFSGVYANLGSAELEGAELAAADLEDELDISIEISTEDTEANPDVGVRNIESLVTQDGIDVAMGGVSSAVAIAMGQWATRNEVAFVASGSHSDATTGSECGRYMWRTPSSNTMLARTAGAGMAEEAESFALMYADYTWGQTARDAVRTVLEDQGVEVVDEVAVPLGADDYTSALSRIGDSGADAMANITAGADTTRSTQQYLNSGMADQVTMHGVLLEDEAMWSLGAEGIAQLGVWGTVWGPAIQEGDMPELIDRVVDEYDKTAYSRHYLGYTSMDQLVRAADRAGSIEAADVRPELEDHNYEDVGLLEGAQEWRGCDHQNLKPTYAVRALDDPGEMSDEPGEQVWFEQVAKAQAEEVARSCEETGCQF